MSAVTVEELAKKVVQLLELQNGQVFEVVRTRDGTVLLRKAER